jgi:2-aminobenzoate-CoA ligase
MNVGSTAHVDTFVREHLPPREMWPATDWSGVPELSYPGKLNAAASLLDDWVVRGHGDRPALHHTGRTWTYGQLLETANRIAHVLVDECGLVPGGRVLLRAANQPLLVACWFGILKAGGVAVTTMPLLRVRELSGVIEKARVSLAFADESVAADLADALAGRPGARIVTFSANGPSELASLMASKSVAFTNVATSAEDPAIIAFTSGTTGRSKGTVHSHRDLLACTDTYARYVLKPTADDVFIGSPPIAFTYALGGLVLFPMRFGASTALIEQAAPPQLLEGIQRFRATTVVSSPNAYRAMLKLSGISISAVCGRACLPARRCRRRRSTPGTRRLEFDLMDGIGSTEMLHIFVGSEAAEAKSGIDRAAWCRGIARRFVDDDGREVPRGTVGRLAVIGPTGCRYLDDHENQRKYVQHGWNLTGDAYRQDADGYFWYESRTDDMIISSGYNVSGVEVENVLLAHASVAECAVVGAPDEARGHIVKAFVVAAAGVTSSDALARELQDFVKAELAPYKYPRAIEFVSELPRTLTGKLQRYRLRSDMAGTTGTTGTLQFHEPAGWAKPKGYANAVSASGRTVFVAGQIGWDPVTMTFPGGDFAGEVRQALTNVVAALAAAGARPDQITRLTWFITDRDEYLRSQAEIGKVYRDVIGRHFPAMSVVVVAGLVEARARVEIEATAWCSESNDGNDERRTTGTEGIMSTFTIGSVSAAVWRGRVGCADGSRADRGLRDHDSVQHHSRQRAWPCARAGGRHAWL